MRNEICFTLRQLRKNPVFTTVAVLTLALGIGATTAIFSALHAVLLRSLPVPNPQELRLINWTGLNPKWDYYTGHGTDRIADGSIMGTSFSYPTYRDFRDHGKGFIDVFAFFAVSRITAVSHGEAAIAGAMLVSGNFLSGYGAKPLMGRSILPEDDRPGAPPVAMITYRWWERYFGKDPGVLDQTIILNKKSFQIIGILPIAYVGPVLGDPSDIYVPLSAQPQLAPSHSLDSPNHAWIQIMGRMMPGANEEQTQATLRVLFQEALHSSKAKMDRPGILLQDGSRGPLMLRQRAAKPFFALMAAVGLVLLIVCANLAGLLLVRGGMREHELAVRVAIGAGRRQLMQQSLIESLVLSLLGTGLGLMIAVWIKQALLDFFTFFPDNFHFKLKIDTNVLLFTLCVSVLITMIFGLLPALRAARTDPLTALKNRSTLSLSHLYLGKALVIAQAGLSVLVIFGAGLMVRTFTNLTHVPLGFDPQHLLLLRLNPGQADYLGQRLIDFYDRTHASLAAIPGVQSVAYSGLVLTGGSSSSEGIGFPGREKRTGEDRDTSVLGVSEDFFQTMSIPILLGRTFQISDTSESGLVAIVNETFVRRFLPNEDPLGQRLALQGRREGIFQIVGVCRDVKYKDVREEVPPLLYYSQRQRPQSGVYFEIRSILPPLSLLPTVRKAVAALDPQIPLSHIKTQEQQIEQSLAADRLFAVLSSALAMLAILLSCIGLYGLMAYNQIRRRREIGIRMALGATPAKVLGKILGEACFLATIGLATGLPLAFLLARLIQNQLYGVAPSDPGTMVAAGLLLLSVAVFSAWFPARRAARVSPMAVLRME